MLILFALALASSAACGNPLSFQVLLDRHGFSPGQIDGQIATNTIHALKAFQSTHGLPDTGAANCVTWRALISDDDNPITTTYHITADDAKGPFTKDIPQDLEKQAGLQALRYRSIEEMLAERFHVAPNLLRTLNRGASFTPGRDIKVPAVAPFDPDAKPARTNLIVSVEVSKDDSSLEVFGADGMPLFFAPVTSGSEHDPLPVGSWHVTSIDWFPKFHYNPDLFWDANPADSRATIAPGPNNPVGVVWIGINVEHYGLHGTPEPGAIGHTQSHGCVRLTNWDAARLASLVHIGTPIIFK